LRFAILCVSIEDECKNRTLKTKKQVILLTKRKNIQKKTIKMIIFTLKKINNPFVWLLFSIKTKTLYHCKFEP